MTRPQSPVSASSWFIISRVTGRAIAETFKPRVASAVRAERYIAMSADEYLGTLNARIKGGDFSGRVLDEELCDDCPPRGYPTDDTRCRQCPNGSAV